MIGLKFFFSFGSILIVNLIIHFLEPERTVLLATGRNVVLFSILLLCVLFFFRFYCFRFKMKKKYGFRLVVFMNFSLLFGISFLGSLIRIYVLSHVGLDLTPFFPLVLSVGAGEGLPLPSGESPYREDSFEMRVLLEPFSETSTEGTSVNQPEGEGPAANPVTPPREEAGPSFQPPRVPYQPDEVIGGDSVDSIARRLLAKYPNPSYADMQRERENAAELFEVKVDIYRTMEGLDPTGDWLGRGTRALENPREHTRMGEPSLGSLLNQLEDLQRGGVRSETYWKLKGKVPLKRMDLPQNSST